MQRRQFVRFWSAGIGGWRQLFLCLGIYYAAVYACDPTRWEHVCGSLRAPDWVLRSLAILSSSSQTSYLGPKWSIDIDLQFYIAACLLLTVFRSVIQVRVALAVISVVCFALFFELQGTYDYPAGVFVPYASTFFLGTLAYYLDWVPSRRLAIASIGAVGVMVGISMLHEDYRYVMVGGPNANRFHQYNELSSFLLALLAVPFAIHTVHQPSPKIDRHIGNLAYPGYLFHMTPILVYRTSGLPKPTVDVRYDVPCDHHGCN
jgi:peptidoglycan/LPS O-acetylase OafA/YrhL